MSNTFNDTPQDFPEEPALTDAQKKDFAEALEKSGRDEEGSPIDAGIMMLKLGMDETVPGLFAEICDSCLYVLVKDFNDLNTLLVLHREDGMAYVPVFSHLEHTQALRDENPQHRYAVQIAFSEICRCIHGEIGLMINPGHVSFQLPIGPQLFEKLREATAQRVQAKIPPPLPTGLSSSPQAPPPLPPDMK